MKAATTRAVTALTGLLTVAVLAVSAAAQTRGAPRNGRPEDHLPANVTQLTWFGERPSWSPDGKRIAFMDKSFGDAFEIDLASRRIRLLTRYPNAGYLREQYLPNGDLFLIGAPRFGDIEKTRFADQEMWILKAGSTAPIRLNQDLGRSHDLAQGDEDRLGQ